MSTRNGFHKPKAKGGPPSKLDTQFSSEQEVRTAMLLDMERSVLGKRQAAAMRVQPYTAQQSLKLDLPVARAGYVLPYFTISGAPSKFFRYRYLEYGHNKGFDALVADSLKRLRYAQPAKSVPELYLPPFLDWCEFANDVTRPIVITEGEKKAACATLHGVPTIGLGGVWSFRSAEKHMPLLPAFADFQWKDREVIVCYDSDAATNWQVIRAENALCRELLRLGAVPSVARIPYLAEGEKCGIDDFIAQRGAEAFTEVLERAEPFKPAQELFQLNEEVLYVQDPGLILRMDTLQKMSVDSFVRHAYAHRVYWEEQAAKNGVTMVEKSAPKEWIKWPTRATVLRITYEPGMERITPTGCINMWKGWGCLPEEGDCRPWMHLLDFLFADCIGGEREWFEQWLAYPLQNPGTKLYTAAVLWGIQHGTGKSLVGYTMQRIYGENATEIGDRELHGTFNEWAEHKQFVMGDEITGGDKRAVADRLKSIITQRQLRLNPKYVPSYTVPDCINYYFTSNHPDSFFLEDTDRRYFIHEVSRAPLPRKFYDNYIHWLDKQHGAQHLFYRLLKLSTEGFHPQGHAPQTIAKIDMMELGRSDLSTWVYNLREDPDRVLKVAGKTVDFCLFTSEELKILYDPENRTKVTANGIAREMRRAGFLKAARGRPIKTNSIGKVPLWAVRKADAVLKLDDTKLALLYDSERKGVSRVVNEAGKKF